MATGGHTDLLGGNNRDLAPVCDTIMCMVPHNSDSVSSWHASMNTQNVSLTIYKIEIFGSDLKKKKCFLSLSFLKMFPFKALNVHSSFERPATYLSQGENGGCPPRVWPHAFQSHSYSTALHFSQILHFSSRFPCSPTTGVHDRNLSNKTWPLTLPGTFGLWYICELSSTSPCQIQFIQAHPNKTIGKLSLSVTHTGAHAHVHRGTCTHTHTQSCKRLDALLGRHQHFQ